MARCFNPYIAGNPVGNGDAFIGRSDIVKKVLQVFSRPQENAIVLYGQRRIGKTSVLQYLKKTLSQDKSTGQYFPIYFDLQDKATATLSDVLTELANTIASELQLAKPQLGNDILHNFQYQWLPQIVAQLPKESALVLLFDEFDVLAADSAQNAGAEFFPYLRQLLASDPAHLNFVFVIGHNTVYKTFFINNWNRLLLSLFQNIIIFNVNLLTKKETFELIRLSEKTSPLKWSEATLERIWQLTNGHAFFTQQLCSFAWETAYDDGDFTNEIITPDIIDSIIDDALNASRHAFEWLWDGLPPAERVISTALAQMGGCSVTETELEKLLHESGVRIVIRELQDALKLLQEWDLLEPVEGGFRFKVELLRRWIEENKPLRRVQDELDRIQPVAENLFQAAQGLYNSSQLKEAENLLRQTIGLNPNHIKANKLLADILLANNQYAEAKKLLTELYQYQPIEARARLTQAWLGLASLANNEEDKLNCYEAILQFDSQQIEAKKAYKTVWIKRGDKALKKGFMLDALEAYKKAEQNEKVAELEEEIKLTEIKRQFNLLGALEQEKNYVAVLALIKNLAVSFPELLNWQEEQERIEKLVNLTTDYQQALAQLELGNNKQAQELLVKVINVDAEFEEAARYLCLAVTGYDCDSLKNNLDKLKIDIDKINNSFKKEKNEHFLIKGKINDYKNEIKKLKVDIDKLTNALKEEKNDNLLLKSQINRLEANIVKLSSSLKKESVNNFSAKIGDYENIIKNLSTDIDKLTNSLKKESDNNFSLKVEINAYENLIKKLKADVDKLTNPLKKENNGIFLEKKSKYKKRTIILLFFLTLLHIVMIESIWIVISHHFFDEYILYSDRNYINIFNFFIILILAKITSFIKYKAIKIITFIPIPLYLIITICSFISFIKIL
jgi:hypothetical protein